MNTKLYPFPNHQSNNDHEITLILSEDEIRFCCENYYGKENIKDKTDEQIYEAFCTLLKITCVFALTESELKADLKTSDLKPDNLNYKYNEDIILISPGDEC